MGNIPLSIDDIARFFEEKIKNKNCPYCGHKDWGIFLSGENQAAALFLENEENFFKKAIKLQNAQFTIPFYCRECGNTIFISRDVIVQWKKKTNG